MYKNYKDDPSSLVPEDQFMMKVQLHKWLHSQGLYIPTREENPRNELVPLIQDHSTPVFCNIPVRRSKYYLEFFFLEDG